VPHALDHRGVSLIGWLALLAAAAIAWVLTAQYAMGMPPGPGTMGLGFFGFLLLWTLMMAAMMLPSVAPVVSLYQRSVRAQASGWPLVLRSVGLVVGYLVAWALFGVVAYFVALWGSWLAAQAPHAAPWVGAVLLAAAGIYQLTPLKDRCLRHCHSPLGFLLHFGNYQGPLRDLRVGLYHGAYCVGCSWGLMVVLITVGVMNLPWMVGLATVIFIEKIWRYGKAFSIAFGVALIIFACFVPWNPSLVPGLYMTGGL
jgi:predicted metal-binding membrane protein